MTRIYYSYINRENHDQLLKDFLPNYPKDFQDKILRYRRWQDAQLSILGRILLRIGLKEMNREGVEKNISYTAYNKPYLKNESIKFNISHSENIVVCAISDVFEIGVDIELLRNIQVDDFKSQMTLNEWERIILSDNITTSFFDYWTQKEAIIKADGIGLLISLKSFEIINNNAVVNGDSFFTKEIDLDNKYKCHLAFKNKIDPIIERPSNINILSHTYKYNIFKP